jgi:energy-coupling factor transporter ATP-binding protein EcfA2
MIAQKTLTIALLGNPNTGKSTLFNALTGLRQHVGNWPGKTVEKAEGFASLPDGRRVRIVDLPGTYALHAESPEERIACEFLLSGEAGCRHRRRRRHQPRPQPLPRLASVRVNRQSGRRPEHDGRSGSERLAGR